MAGVEYATLGGQELWTALTGIRLFWGHTLADPFRWRRPSRAGFQNEPRAHALKARTKIHWQIRTQALTLRLFMFAEVSTTRRRFVRHCAAGLLTLGTGTATWSSGWERRQPVLRQNILPCPNLRKSQHGLKVLHLSDLHADDWTPTVAIERAVAFAHATQPDLIVFTGDYITRDAQAFYPAARALADLRAPLGLFASMGNHDLWNRPRVVTDSLTRLGIRPLVNQSVRLQAPGGPLWITGIDSAWGGHPDPRSALRHWNTKEPNLILMHEPDYADFLAQDRLAATQLSGHTHGGQVRAPFLGAIAKPHLGRKYTLGNYRSGDIHLYVNAGLGTMNLPFRFLCPPEVTLHTLVPA
jgi:predicted MPP superfamily phosphohydrolase